MLAKRLVSDAPTLLGNWPFGSTSYYNRRRESAVQLMCVYMQN